MWDGVGVLVRVEVGVGVLQGEGVGGGTGWCVWDGVGVLVGVALNVGVTVGVEAEPMKVCGVGFLTQAILDSSACSIAPVYACASNFPSSTAFAQAM